MSTILADLLNEVSNHGTWADPKAKIRQLLYEAYADGFGDGYCQAGQDAREVHA